MAMGVTGVSGRAFPAHAGVNRRREIRSNVLRRVPRVCGDEPACGGDDFLATVRSLRMQG